MIPAVRVRDLGKRYRLGARAPYRTLRDYLVGIEAPLAKGRDLWALRGLSFDVEEGGILGIIGRNGAGKSTLLKILSRITWPTEGQAEIRGRVRSLLEVGTGFHPELTGRENIFLNGALLGMARREIRNHFDSIVEFAEIASHLDTPIKHYSSGMQARLGFSVAAHLRSEILIVDEVLAVGDAAFQRRCLGKMDEASREGRTILFVSHQMNAVRRLCHRCLWLEAGRSRMLDATAPVVAAYESQGRSGASTGREGGPPVRFLGWAIEGAGGGGNILEHLGPMAVRVVLQADTPVRNGANGIALRDASGLLVWAWARYELDLPAGRHTLRYALPGLPLRPGCYSIHLSISQDDALLDEWLAAPDLVVSTPPLTHPRDEWSGILNLPCDFAVLAT